MTTGIIYCATSRTTGKKYIGQTVRTLARRRQSHESNSRRGSMMAFHCALRKYGPGDFTWTVLEVLPVELLDASETEAIQRHGTAEHGYNVARQGGNQTMLGLKRGPFSEEHKRKISEAHIGKKTDPDHLRKLWEGRDKWQPSEEQRQRRRGLLKGFKHTEEARQNMSAAQRGRVFTEEHRRRLSEAHKGKKPPPMSEETRRKISDAARAQHARRRAALELA